MQIDQSVESAYQNLNPIDPLHVLGEVYLPFVSVSGGSD